jgi:serine/threonine protein kinase
MIDLKGNIKIIDFGFSSYPVSSKKYLKNYAGTPVYMSPELIHEIPYNGKD